MSAIVDALLGEMTDADLRELAEKLKPFLIADDGWLSAKDAAAYAGCSIHALRHALKRGDLEHEQHADGCKVWVRRSAIDRWRGTQ